MSDLLVKLYDLPETAEKLKRLEADGVRIRRPGSYERHRVVDYVRETFDAGWASECEVSFGRQPISSFIATESGHVIGFACCNCTRKGFFGPTGVSETARGRGIGEALLLTCLRAMAEDGYAYAIIGASSANAFYARTVGAVVIEGSDPGIYDDPLGDPTTPRGG